MVQFLPTVLRSVVAASSAVILLCRQQRQNYRNVWMRPHIPAREAQGAYINGSGYVYVSRTFRPSV